MPARQESCCFTGHRPAKLPWGYNERDPRCVRLKERIADAVLLAYQEGYRHFLCGMAQGCDLYFCEAVLALRERYPEVTVEAAIQFSSASSRKFVLVLPLDEKAGADESALRQLEKAICDHGLRVRLAEEQDVKRLLAIYYQQDLTTEVFRDFDGEEYVHG